KPDRLPALEKLQEKYGPDRTEIVEDLLGVIHNSNIIASAITERIDLDSIDPEAKLDLTGKVFIDDSQPGCFDRAQIEQRGGHLLWVVGHDPKGRVSRVHGYTFGTEEGLVGDSNWGCELEAWLIAKTGRRDLALRGPVTPEKVRAIGEAMKREGIKAGPFQSFGRLVYLPLKKKSQVLAA
ncbi:MAG TPA: hypothetical protein VFT87_05175, partial [Candidatus Saccharimonadales bacterium]|nr:hypothetical protein [Candidatus Saccharimonadales bacterium]